MADAFDPYLVWLRIPAERRPVSHFELLRVSPKEFDREMIRAAAERRRSQIEPHTRGPRSIYAKALLYEIDEAVETLADPALRQEYLQNLRRARRRQEPPPVSSIASNSRSVVVGILIAAAVAAVIGGVTLLLIGKSNPGVAAASPVLANPVADVEDGTASAAVTSDEIGASAAVPKKPPAASANHPAASAADADTAVSQLPTASSEAAFGEAATEPRLSRDHEEATLETGNESMRPLPHRQKLNFETLFNGRDLTGWQELRSVVLQDHRRPDGKFVFRFEPTRGAWTARDGDLVCVSRGENSQGLIRTERQFSDFVLKLEFRVPPDCNSKILLRLPELAVGRADDEGVAVQIADDYGRSIADPEGRTGAIYGVAGPSRNLLRPNGAWNEIEVRCEGSRIRVTLNDELAADVDIRKEPLLRDRPRAGYVGFACFGKDVDGPWFRNIVLADLGEPPLQTDREGPRHRPQSGVETLVDTIRLGIGYRDLIMRFGRPDAREKDKEDVVLGWNDVSFFPRDGRNSLTQLNCRLICTLDPSEETVTDIVIAFNPLPASSPDDVQIAKGVYGYVRDSLARRLGTPAKETDAPNDFLSAEWKASGDSILLSLQKVNGSMRCGIGIAAASDE